MVSMFIRFIINLKKFGQEPFHANNTFLCKQLLLYKNKQKQNKKQDNSAKSIKNCLLFFSPESTFFLLLE